MGPAAARDQTVQTMSEIRSFVVLPALPDSLKPVRELAHNLWWTWNPAAIELFRRLDVDLWRVLRHNPVGMLARLKQERLDRLGRDPAYSAALARVRESRDSYLDQPTWVQETYGQEAVGTIAYFSFDNPGQSPRMPIWAGVTELPESFKIDCQHSYREDSACWWYRRANRLSQIKWGWAREYLEPAVMAFEDQMFMEQPLIEHKAVELMEAEGVEDPMEFRTFLTRYTNNWAGATMQKWWELGDFFWAYFARGW